MFGSLSWLVQHFYLGNILLFFIIFNDFHKVQPHLRKLFYNLVVSRGLRAELRICLLLSSIFKISFSSTYSPTMKIYAVL